MSNIVNFDNLYRADSISKLGKPYEEYDINGKLIGYSWSQGENVTLKFDIIGYVTIDADSIILKAVGDEPDLQTVGTVGMKCYNVVDLKSWTCTLIIESEDSTTYIWNEDAEFTYPETGTTNVYLSAKDYVANKQIQISIYTPQFNLVYSDTVDAGVSIEFPITDNIVELLKSGTYYLTLALVDSNSYKTLNLISDKECTILIK